MRRFLLFRSSVGLLLFFIFLFFILSLTLTIDFIQPFKDKTRKDVILRASSLLNDSSSTTGSSGVFEEEERTNLSFHSHPSFTPKPGEGFITSFLFQLNTPPQFDRRQRLIMHYESGRAPYAGWAIALRRLPSSNRFEFYLQDNFGKGGWFSFDAVSLEIGQWYAFTVVLEPSTFISAYISTLPDENLIDTDFSRFPANNNKLNNSLVASGELQRDSKKRFAGQFTPLGGFPLEGLSIDTIKATLQITSGSPRIGPFKGRVEEFTILRVPQLGSANEFMKSAREGPKSLLISYPDSCVISLSPYSKNCEIQAQEGLDKVSTSD
ncbi:MAG TPA: hypothetical protein PKA63_04655 [Oligoflexia bacterium]|nr:hypothetical protein [Oligoflexia bacterium]HMP47941.1 hypothetical protein [Oligoflexia bacterium]